MSPDLSTAAVYTDFQGLDSLKLAAKSKSPEAVRAVAKQFEALFVQMMLKSMRQASGSDPLFDSQQTAIYRDMYDKQLALDVSEKGRGIGLADMLVKQLQTLPEFRNSQAAQASAKAELTQPLRRSTITPVSAVRKDAATTTATRSAASPSNKEIGTSPVAFVEKLWPLAKRAAAKIGTSAEALIAQAALETGWGKSVIRGADGSSSHNLFNIKADEQWHGDSVAKQTVEYRHGVAAKEVAQFRSYKSFADSFDDYVKFLQSNPRYQQALDSAGNPARFMQSLQQAGYATDPNYASKINEIMGRQVFADARSSLKSSADGTLT